MRGLFIMSHTHRWKIERHEGGEIGEGWGRCKCGEERTFTNEQTHYRSTNRMSGNRASIKARQELKVREALAVEEARS